jgi:YD repeat-containing protein
VIETYKYALDFTPSGNFIKQMVDNHIVNEPIEYIRKEKSAIVTAYYKKYITNNSRDIYECDFSKYPAISFGIDEYGNLTSSTFYKKRYSLNLDASGNLLSINKEDISPTSFIYGYNNTKPIVAIENIDYSQISTAILSSIRNHTFSESGQVGDIIADINFVKSSLGSLYKDKNCLITIYTYKPLVGVTSMTNPLGATIFYEYDLSGRLQYIKDNNGKVIEHYKYHFKP